MRIQSTLFKSTQVVDLHMKNGKRPYCDKYIGRYIQDMEFYESKWANPGLSMIEYEKMILLKIKSNPEKYNLQELKHKILGCWCINTTSFLHPICHGQILLKLLDRLKDN